MLPSMEMIDKGFVLANFGAPDRKVVELFCAVSTNAARGV